ARGVLSVAERTAYIARVRGLARLCAEGYVAMHSKATA
ncbi:MAG: glycine--tRNA ligase subunit alpha, partial [Nitrospirota bacterium]